MTIYTTFGHVRGCSGVKHRTREAAERAVEQDARRCRKNSGYSDRGVAVVVDGRLYHDEEGRFPLWPAHGQSTGAVEF